MFKALMRAHRPKNIDCKPVVTKLNLFFLKNKAHCEPVREILRAFVTYECCSPRLLYTNTNRHW